MKWIDLPPVWLLGALFVARIIPLNFTPGGVAALGWVALVLGVLLTVFAVIAFASARTTIVPRRTPEALISGGVFQLSRNPIYLADVLFLTGASLIWGSWIGLFLVPVYVWLLDQRFIRGEEVVLQEAYGAEYAEYCDKVRRWI
ncbi:isoprenylcysteine carboxylmethyltransferase family protein [Rhodobacteraceae bacterium]|nr:isoprenylcysteine carboxylmethyltransferase family protein [Paracoccaceae bacterium]